MNNSIQTFTGKEFYPLDAWPDDVDIADIAHALSMICRFNGHCREFYSVAEHSVLVAEAATEYGADASHALRALMHDAAEAYLLDIPTPVKALLPNYKAAEDRLCEVLASVFGYKPGKSALICELDSRIVVTEMLALMSTNTNPWNYPPLDIRIACDPPPVAEQNFLDMFQLLTAGERNK